MNLQQSKSTKVQCNLQSLSAFLALFQPKPVQQQPAVEKPERAHIRAVECSQGWCYSITDADNRTLIFKPKKSVASSQYRALNRGVRWCRQNLPNTPVAILLPIAQRGCAAA